MLINLTVKYFGTSCVIIISIYFCQGCHMYPSPFQNPKNCFLFFSWEKIIYSTSYLYKGIRKSFSPNPRYYVKVIINLQPNVGFYFRIMRLLYLTKL